MGRLTALLLIVWLMLLLQRVVPADSIASLRSVSLAIGFALVAASLLGAVAERLRLPRLSGYLLFGLLCGPYVLNLLTPVMARQLQVVNGLAIALIALIAGLEINFGRLRGRLAPLIAFGGTTIIIAFAGLLTLFLASWPWLPVAPDAAGLNRIAIALVLTTLVVSFSPTVTIAVIAECRARGPLSELVLAIVVLADLALILVFTLAMQFARSTMMAEPGEVNLLVRLAWEIGGSIAFGALLGAGFALYLRLVGRELSVVLLGLCALITGAAGWLHFEALLVALTAGIVVENIAPPEGDALRTAIERSAVPILVVFFAAAGASLRLDALADIGLLALAIAFVRFIWIRIGTAAAGRLAALPRPQANAAWTGLISQAGVTLGLTTIVAAEFAGWGARVQTLMVALIALHELLGPVLFRAALARLGEVGGLDLTPAPAGSPTTSRTP